MFIPVTTLKGTSFLLNSDKVDYFTPLIGEVAGTAVVFDHSDGSETHIKETIPEIAELLELE